MMIIAVKGLRQNKGTVQMCTERQRFQQEKRFELLLASDILTGSALSAAVRSESFLFLSLSGNAAAAAAGALIPGEG